MIRYPYIPFSPDYRPIAICAAGRRDEKTRFMTTKEYLLVCSAGCWYQQVNIRWMLWTSSLLFILGGSFCSTSGELLPSWPHCRSLHGLLMSLCMVSSNWLPFMFILVEMSLSISEKTCALDMLARSLAIFQLCLCACWVSSYLEYPSRSPLMAWGVVW